MATESVEAERESRLGPIRVLIADHAKAKGERVRLEQFRKIRKATLMREAEAHGVKSAALQEREAYANPGYAEIVDGLAAATEIEARTYWELQLAGWRFEEWRTRRADARAEFARYTGG